MTLNAVLDVGFGVGFATATQRKLATEVAAAVHPGGDGGLRLSAADLDQHVGHNLIVLTLKQVMVRDGLAPIWADRLCCSLGFFAVLSMWLWMLTAHT